MRILVPPLAAAVIASILSCPTPAGSQPEPGAPIQPTVTATMKNAGGTFFGRQPDPRKSHRYYIAAEPELWDYAPSGRDEICGKPLPPPVVANRNAGKLRYVQYTDESFAAKVIPNPSLGVMGPVLRGVVGDYLVITFFNRTGQPLSMHPHGVRYDKDSEGAYYRPGPGLGAAVGPGAKFTYVWQLDESSGPQPGEPSSKGWLYHSHVVGDEEINQGLVGGIVVTDPGRARPDGTPADVDREFAALFMIFDESGLGEAEKEAAEYASLPGGGPPAKTWTQVQELVEQGSRYAINGRIFGNLPGLEMNEGERTRWYLFGLGSERDFHTAHWHGLRVLDEGRRRTDVVELLPATMKVADLVADNPGSWLLHCHVAEHMTEGMFVPFVIHARDRVGVDRSPERAFLGLTGAKQSLRIGHAGLRLDRSGGAAASGTLTLRGEASVFEAFSVFKHPVRIQLGEKSVTFQPNSQGAARAPGGVLQIKNVGASGVVYGQLMEFEVVLSGADWLAELKKNGLMATDEAIVSDKTMPLTMEIGAARHTTAVRIGAP